MQEIPSSLCEPLVSVSESNHMTKDLTYTSLTNTYDSWRLPSFPLLNYFCYGSFTKREYLNVLQACQGKVPQFLLENFALDPRKMLYLKCFVKLGPLRVNTIILGKRRLFTLQSYILLDFYPTD